MEYVCHDRSIIMQYISLLFTRPDASSLLPTDTGVGYKQPKARLGRNKVRSWKWTSFTNPARNVSLFNTLFVFCCCPLGTYVHTYVHTYVCVHVYAYILMYVHTYICMYVNKIVSRFLSEGSKGDIGPLENFGPLKICEVHL